MLIVAAVKAFPWLAFFVIIGLIFAIAGLLRNIQPAVYSEKTEIHHTKICLFPAFLHLGLVLILGVYLPPIMRDLLQQATKIITGT